VFAGLVVSDIERAKDWYAALFGREPDILPNDVEAMWQLTPTANLYLLADVSRAGGGVATIALSDLEAVVAAATRGGLSIGPIEPVGDAGSKAIATDHDGNEIHLIQLR
jgi:predicted enzyme related to lactoylglutathione lyase